MRLLRAELLKLRTTRLWLVLSAVALVMWAVALLFNALIVRADRDVEVPDPSAVLVGYLNYWTSGYLVSMTVALVLGTTVMTAEFQHRTALATFLVSPHRTPVLLAKSAAAAIGGLLLWAGTTLLTLAASPLALPDGDPRAVGPTHPDVWPAIVLSGLTFALWAMLGVGVGALVRHQAGAAALALGVNFAGTLALVAAVAGLAALLGEGVVRALTAVPAVASAMLVFGGGGDDGLPPRWVLALVLVGWAVLATVVGAVLVRRRDVG
ncbi:hypothetical protein GCM10010123_34240 [Pilimelia anulata]|uniref:ABC transporter permease n=1 Tax=Pilimelia anulata TaxID=53371 RepID=A0A8J3FEQ5_9ACTN|nr:ABC transporter permease [Pilimelia anulata]GGK01522.1 hypothetical protein GCM10010123_34240 [Pilimelia anulata]